MSDEQREAVERRHTKVDLGGGSWAQGEVCRVCKVPFPCDAITLAHQLREAQAELEMRRVIFRRLSTMPESEQAVAYENERKQLYRNTKTLMRLQCPKVRPSCLLCGQQKEFVVQHAEVMIGVCADCRQAKAKLAELQDRHRQE